MNSIAIAIFVILVVVAMINRSRLQAGSVLKEIEYASIHFTRDSSNLRAAASEGLPIDSTGCRGLSG